MTDRYKLNETRSPIDPSSWSELNQNWELIKSYLRFLERQIKFLAGGAEIDDILLRIDTAIANAENATSDVQQAKQEIETILADLDTLVTEAQIATENANNAASDANTLNTTLTVLKGELQTLQTNLNNIVQSETQRVADETARRENEAARVLKEQARETAEQQRSTTFNSKMTDAEQKTTTMQNLIQNLVSYNYTPGTTYEFPNLVKWDGGTFIALKKVTGVTPTDDGVNYRLIAKKGDKGDTGAGLNILGQFNEPSELPASGDVGDAYLIGGNLYIWGGSAWVDGGNIKGPKGDTATGIKFFDYTIDATDTTQVALIDGATISPIDYIHNADTDTIEVFRNSRILYPGSDYAIEDGTIRVIQPVAEPDKTTFYIRVTRVVYRIDEDAGRETVVNALGYTPANSTNLAEVDQRLTQQLAQTTNILRNQLSVLDFENTVVDDDWSYALIAAHNALPAEGGIIVVPSPIIIKKPVTFQKRIYLKGVGFSHSVNSSPLSTILKVGNFTGLTFLGWNSFIENIDVEGAPENGGDGINIVGSRTGMRNVGSRKHGGHGIRVGRFAGDNTNGWNFTNLFTIKNGVDGLHLHYGELGNSTIPDLTAGILSGIDTRDNGRDGIHLGNTLNNTFLGVMSQHNGRHGVYTGANATGNYFFNPYTELNLAGRDKEFMLDVDSRQNVVLGQRSRLAYDSITDNGTANLIMSTNSQISGSPYFFKSGLALRELKVSNRNISGDWNFTQSDNRDLLIELLGTSAGGKVVLKKSGAPLQLDVDRLSFNGIKYMDNLISDSRTLNTTNIPANSTVDIAIPITGARTTDMVTCTPRGQVPAGLMWQAYIHTNDTVTLRLTNITGAQINSQNIAFKTTVIGTSI